MVASRLGYAASLQFAAPHPKSVVALHTTCMRGMLSIGTASSTAGAGTESAWSWVLPTDAALTAHVPHCMMDPHVFITHTQQLFRTDTHEQVTAVIHTAVKCPVPEVKPGLA